jgi:hypothetical protein
VTYDVPRMRITVDVNGRLFEFERNWFTGTANFWVAGAKQPLASPLDAGTHFSLELIRRWQCQVASHHVVIEKHRPRWFAGFRPQTFRILVDGALVAERRGY